MAPSLKPALGSPNPARCFRPMFPFGREQDDYRKDERNFALFTPLPLRFAAMCIPPCKRFNSYKALYEAVRANEQNNYHFNRCLQFKCKSDKTEVDEAWLEFRMS